ncbi:MAG: DUF4442 domain-containing protein [Bacteroidetes bacterium]|nr:DUF4442 domain-containing protein [Bacteroidota bacterium]
MNISERQLTWLMRFYPPMLFQRIWVQKIHPGFRQIDVKINRSLFTNNLGNSIFGGTLFSAIDPFYALLLGQIMEKKGIPVVVWLKSARIDYLKPARTDMHFSLEISEELIEEAIHHLKKEGKFVKELPAVLYDKNGAQCATATNEIYLKNKDFNSP